jgi:hypothetical protein
MKGRTWVRMTGMLGLVFALVLGAVANAGAQTITPTETERVAQCVDNAADSFVECVDESNWFGDLLCASKYAADAILCVPPRILKLT